MEGRGRMEEKMRALLLRKGKKEVDMREGRGVKGRGRDLPEQCQSASYVPAITHITSKSKHVGQVPTCFAAVRPHSHAPSPTCTAQTEF